MSGLCGWLGTASAAPDDNLATLTRMAQPLGRFDASLLTALAGQTGAVAVCAGAGACHHYQDDDGLVIMLWGHATLTGAAANVAANLAPLWRSRGPLACQSLGGPFALCILDERSGQALLAVDRSGTHGLCFQTGSTGLMFASSADALAAHPAGRRGIAPQALYDYLYFHMVPGPATIHCGQQRLLPGEYLHYRAGAAQRASYWELRYEEQTRRSFGANQRQFLDTLRGAVGDSIDGSVPGAFLSGGTDSSTIAAMLGQVSGAAARTYSIGFDAPGYDELAYARLAARHFGTLHHELYVGPADVADIVPRLAALFDQPFGNASAVPAFYCARMARADGVTRLLGGDGGDELFGGNERYARQAVFARYERMPSMVRQTVIEPLLFHLAAGQQQRWLRKARSYIEQALTPMPARLENYNLLRRYGPASVLEPDFLAQVDPGQPLASLNAAYGRTHGHSQINQMLALDMKFTLADNDLPKVIKACELAGIEVAFPFLSDAMVAFAARLAPRQKLNGTRLRYFFKRALVDVLPGAILRKQKHGFGLPFGYWLPRHTGLRQLAYDSLSDLKWRRIVRPAFIDELLERHVASHPAYHGTMVWVLMMLEQWLAQRNIAGAGTGTEG